MTLRLIISDNCEACKRAQSLLELIKANYPFLNIETVHINSLRNKKIFITPALLIDDKLFSYGDIDKNRLLKKINKV
ncbi:thioredoxin family protein [Melioribacteraceae bacterium 4301-Me]|uniref:thioredoxin family protein n=1 Tax=Pyranulibacter aquaticus TaxID=3163344 RepID=UPI003594B6B6